MPIITAKYAPPSIMACANARLTVQSRCVSVRPPPHHLLFSFAWLCCRATHEYAEEHETATH